MPAPAWAIDPDDPRAPPEDVWAALSPAERRRVVDSLPSDFPVSDANPPEGDPHFNAKAGVKSVLGDHFARMGRRVYLACELPVYYPGERMFAPDVLAVLDVDTHERTSRAEPEPRRRGPRRRRRGARKRRGSARKRRGGAQRQSANGTKPAPRSPS